MKPCLAAVFPTKRRIFHRLPSAVNAQAATEKWWEKKTENMVDVNSVQELVDVLADAGDKLVILDFFAPWCSACRALYPKLMKLIQERPEVLCVKVNFELNKQMCKTMGVKVLPFFHFYHGASGRVAAFSCTVSKLQRLKDALDLYDAPQCSLEPFNGLEEFPDVHPHEPQLPEGVTRLEMSSYQSPEPSLGSGRQLAAGVA